MTQQAATRHQGTLCVMGSGETAPTMVKVHRSLLDFSQRDSVEPLYSVIDTPYGFQENADELSQKALEYFRVSLNKSFKVASLRSLKQVGGYEQDVFYDQLQRSQYLFAGPGSPTYALRVWEELSLGSLLSKILLEPKVVTFSSAAALTLGSFTLPVYEIYKAGEQVRWEVGLGLFEKLFALKVAVIPHFNNQEGGTHDTRYCYMGEHRIKILENALPDDAFILGVDEHSGVIFDLAARNVETVGIGTVTLRKHGNTTQIPSGEKMDIETFLNITSSMSTFLPRAKTQSSGFDTGADRVTLETTDTARTSTASDPLEAELIRLKKDFEAAIDISNFEEASKKILELESTLTEWSTDTLLSDFDKQGRALLRSMVVRLGSEAASKSLDKSFLLAPFIEFLLKERSVARSAKNFTKSDEIRDFLVLSGIDIQDSPQGTSWSLRDAIVSSTDN